MSLENVNIWEDGKGYVPISVEEACERYSHTVSYHSEIFICKLCGNYVTLTESKSGKKERHFRHSRLDYDKKINADRLCKDRSKFTAQIYQDASPLALHVMPMRIVVNPNCFSLEIGFYCPNSVQDLKDGSISISNSLFAFNRHFYVDRIVPGETTYLSVGSTILDEYLLSHENIPHQLAQFWPNKVEGFFDHGGVFYASSGKRIYRGAKVTLNHDFLFLFSHKHLNWFLANTSSKEVDRKEIYEFKTVKESWLVYKVRLTHINKNSTDLFLKYGIELAEQAPDLYQFWPPKIYSSNQIINCARELYFYLNGHADKVQLYPKQAKLHGRDSLLSVPTEHGTIFKVIPSQKAQLLTLGAYGALGYNYLQYDESELSAGTPKLSITNNLGQILDKTSYDDISDWKYLSIASEVDGKLKIYENGKLINIHRIKGGNDNKLLLSKSDLVLGRRYDFFQSCTLIHSLELIAPKIEKERAESPLAKPETPKFSFRDVDLALRQTLQFCLLASLGYQHLGSHGLFEHLNSRKHPILALKDYISSTSMTKAVVNENTSVSTLNNCSTRSSISSKALFKKMFAPKTSYKQDLSLIPAKAQDHDVKQDQASTIDLKAKFHVLDQQEFDCNEQQIIKLSSQFALKNLSQYQSSPLYTKLYGYKVFQVALKHLKYDDYPLTIKWLKKHAEQGTLNDQVMRNLMSFF